jgi:hypothetical protein
MGKSRKRENLMDSSLTLCPQRHESSRMMILLANVSMPDSSQPKAARKVSVWGVALVGLLPDQSHPPDSGSMLPAAAVKGSPAVSNDTVGYHNWG